LFFFQQKKQHNYAVFIPTYTIIYKKNLHKTGRKTHLSVSRQKQKPMLAEKSTL